LDSAEKKTLFASERHTERVQKLRVAYWQTIGEVKLKDLVFIDEAGVNLGMTRRYARAEKGKRAYGQAPATRGKNVTMIGALSVSGLLAPMTWQGSTDGITFLTYVEQVLAPTLWEGACVVMDNFKSHQVEGIRAAIEAVGAKLVYLSPYSPDFSPIENCWSKLKESLRAQAARTYNSLNEAIAIAINEITEKDIMGWFTHCCYCGQDD
jgi:transposase